MRVEVVTRQETKKKDREQNPANPGANVNILPRQTFCEGVKAERSNNEMKEDSVVVATFSSTSPIAAASQRENKLSLLTVRPSSAGPQTVKTIPAIDADR